MNSFQYYRPKQSDGEKGIFKYSKTIMLMQEFKWYNNQNLKKLKLKPEVNPAMLSLSHETKVGEGFYGQLLLFCSI